MKIFEKPDNSSLLYNVEVLCSSGTRSCLDIHTTGSKSKKKTSSRRTEKDKKTSTATYTKIKDRVWNKTVSSLAFGRYVVFLGVVKVPNGNCRTICSISPKFQTEKRKNNDDTENSEASSNVNGKHEENHRSNGKESKQISESNRKNGSNGSGDYNSNRNKNTKSSSPRKSKTEDTKSPQLHTTNNSSNRKQQERDKQNEPVKTLKNQEEKRDSPNRSATTSKNSKKYEKDSQTKEKSDDTQNKEASSNCPNINCAEKATNSTKSNARESTDTERDYNKSKDTKTKNRNLQESSESKVQSPERKRSKERSTPTTEKSKKRNGPETKTKSTQTPDEYYKEPSRNKKSVSQKKQASQDLPDRNKSKSSRNAQNRKAEPGSNKKLKQEEDTQFSNSASGNNDKTMTEPAPSTSVHSNKKLDTSEKTTVTPHFIIRQTSNNTCADVDKSCLLQCDSVTDDKNDKEEPITFENGEKCYHECECGKILKIEIVRKTNNDKRKNKSTDNPENEEIPNFNEEDSQKSSRVDDSEELEYSTNRNANTLGYFKIIPNAVSLPPFSLDPRFNLANNLSHDQTNKQRENYVYDARCISDNETNASTATSSLDSLCTPNGNYGIGVKTEPLIIFPVLLTTGNGITESFESNKCNFSHYKSLELKRMNANDPFPVYQNDSYLCSENATNSTEKIVQTENLQVHSQPYTVQTLKTRTTGKEFCGCSTTPNINYKLQELEKVNETRSAKTLSNLQEKIMALEEAYSSTVYNKSTIKNLHDKIAAFEKACPSTCYDKSGIKKLQMKIDALEELVLKSTQGSATHKLVQRDVSVAQSSTCYPEKEASKKKKLSLEQNESKVSNTTSKKKEHTNVEIQLSKQSCEDGFWFCRESLTKITSCSGLPNKDLDKQAQHLIVEIAKELELHHRELQELKHLIESIDGKKLKNPKHDPSHTTKSTPYEIKLSHIKEKPKENRSKDSVKHITKLTKCSGDMKVIPVQCLCKHKNASKHRKSSKSNISDTSCSYKNSNHRSKSKHSGWCSNLCKIC